MHSPTTTRSSHKTLRMEPLEERALLSVVGPTAHEQYLLELINRGRLDPPAEAARYGIDLNQGLAPGTISADPKQPLTSILRKSASLV